MPGKILVVLVLALLSPLGFADVDDLAAAGKRHFIRCAPCHAVSAEAPPRFGPHLEAIVDRRAGMVAGFDYTDEKIATQSFVWDETYFQSWLKAPQAEYPAMCLPFTGIAKAEVRRELLAYLKTL